MHKLIALVLTLVFLFGFIGCSNHQEGESRSQEISSDNLVKGTQVSDSAQTNSLNMRNEELIKIYALAIAEFIKAVYKNNNTRYDTLIFLKHVYGQADDFPDIELPETIEKTKIQLINPELVPNLQVERKSPVYVNMMAWLDSEKADFLFVVFSNAMRHQYDYRINFTLHESTDKPELNEIIFENYHGPGGQKPEALLIYKKDNQVKRWK